MKNEGERRRACKPGSVESGHFSGTAVARRLKRSTRGSRRAGPARQGPLFDLAPGGVYQARPVSRPAGALLPHRFTLASWDPGGSPIGGLFSVALSLSLRTVGVTHHRVLRSPDFPPRGWFVWAWAQTNPPRSDHSVLSGSPSAVIVGARTVGSTASIGHRLSRSNLAGNLTPTHPGARLANNALRRGLEFWVRKRATASGRSAWP